jgi:NTE family protein
MDDASDYHERLLTELLATLFGDLDAAAAQLLRDHLRWVEVAGGTTLMAEGEPGDSMYISVSGRLRAYVRQDDGSARMVREMSRGQVIGEMSLFTGELRSATVVAIRDSVLVRLEKADFDRLIAASAPIGVALTRQIIQRLKTEHQPVAYAAPVTVGVMAVTDGLEMAPLMHSLAAQLARFGRVKVIDVATVMQALGLDPNASRSGDAAADAYRRIALWLDEVETTHDFVLLCADPGPTSWSRLCSRHADEILLLADASRAPAVHPVETHCLVDRPPRTEAAQILVLLHEEHERCPVGTAAWLARRSVDDHLHVRPALERDVARLARVIARQAVGLVLAGGGARGFAHLGVLRALQERGVEVDFVGGTSMGAVMAVLVGSDQPLDLLMRAVRRAFARNPTGDFNLVPLVSIFAGRRRERVLRQAMIDVLGREAAIEDLWKNYFCIATNYSQAREERLTHGDLQAAVLASGAIPGALPPMVRDGDLLCDGATFNNFPVDVMRTRRGVGCVVGVDLSARKARRMEIDAVPGPWALLRDRLRPRKARRFHLPSLSSILLNATILYSESRLQASARLIDVHFKPPLDRVGLLQWNRIDDITRQGYEHAVEVLQRPPVQARLALLAGAPSRDAHA